MLTVLAGYEQSGDGEGSADKVSDGGSGGLALAGRHSGDGAIACMYGRSPVGSEAVGDLAEDYGRADFLLAAVVGRRHAAVGEEDEELASPLLDLALQLAFGRMGSGHPEQSIEAALGLGGVSQRVAGICGIA